MGVSEMVPFLMNYHYLVDTAVFLLGRLDGRHTVGREHIS